MPKLRINTPGLFGNFTYDGLTGRAPITPDEIQKTVSDGGKIEESPIIYVNWDRVSKSSLFSPSMCLSLVVSKIEILRLADRIRQEEAEFNNLMDSPISNGYGKVTIKTLPFVREEANSLIRATRTARNATFGIDE